MHVGIEQYPTHQCDKLLGLALDNHYKCIHVNDVVTDWSCALAGFLVYIHLKVFYEAPCTWYQKQLL